MGNGVIQFPIMIENVLLIETLHPINLIAKSFFVEVPPHDDKREKKKSYNAIINVRF